MSDNDLSLLKEQLQNLKMQIDNILFNNQIQDDQIKEQIKNIICDIDYIKNYELQKFILFGNKVNQAYVNQEVQNINMVQDIDQLKQHQADMIQNIDQLQRDNKDLIKDSINIENWLHHADQHLQELSNDQNLLFQALYNTRYMFDTFNEMLTKERIMNTAIITVLTIELLSKGVIDNNGYINGLKAVIHQILDAYKSAGVNIDFSQELESLTTGITNNGIAIRMPQMVNVVQSQTNEDFQEDKNIIDFKDILKNKAKKSKNVNAEKKSKLYIDFQNKLNEVLAKKKNNNTNNKKNNKDNNDPTKK